MRARAGTFQQTRLPAAVLAFALIGVLAGCQSVQRRMTIRSNPPRALVMVDGREIGYTPTSVDFTYYATREITLIKDGYQTLTTKQSFKRPWYQWPGIDFFSDNFLPMTVTNRHDITYTLQPKQSHNPSTLRSRAESFRSRAIIGNGN